MWRLLKHEGITHFNAAPTVNTLLCRSPQAEKLPRKVRVTVAASPPSAKLFEDMIALNLIPVHVYGLVCGFHHYYTPSTNNYISDRDVSLRILILEGGHSQGLDGFGLDTDRSRKAIFYHSGLS